MPGSPLQDILRAAGPFIRCQIACFTLIEHASEMPTEIAEPCRFADQPVRACPIEAGIVACQRRRQPGMAPPEVREKGAEVGVRNITAWKMRACGPCGSRFR